MAAVAVIALLLASIVTIAGTLLVFPAMWGGFRDQWRHTPPARRPRAIAGAVAAAAYVAVTGAVAIVAPWGVQSIVYVILFGGGGLMVVVLVGVTIEGLRASRRAREQRHRHT